MGKDIVLESARRLHALGMAVIWLRPKSKIPAESGWTSGPRKSWEELLRTYRTGMNVGVRLGTPSRIGLGYLAVIDIDVKDEKYRVTAVEAAKKLLGGVVCPLVFSGRGNGSRHYYGLTEKPFKTVTPLRVKDCWEVSLYSDGRQVVLPPSIHPDTGNAYRWGIRAVEKAESLPMLKLEKVIEAAREAKGGASKEGKKVEPGKVKADFKVSPVDLAWLPISEEVRAAIVKGTGVTDRSGYLLRASTALLSAGLNEDEVLTVLTDATTYLGKCAYEHARTDSRKRAAEWVRRYTLGKVTAERSGEIFRGLPLPEPAPANWKDGLVRNSRGGGWKPCFKNALLILENEFGSTLFHKDDFSLRRTYGMKTPWGGESGREVSDEDITAIKRYLVEKYDLEVDDKHIVSAVTSISSRNHHHPVRDYLDSLEWDGVARVDTWLKDFAGVKGPDEYLRAISRKVLCAMVARAYKPGIKFDYVLILEGPNQGEGKSRSIEALASPDWAGTVRFDMDHKDFVLALQGRWATEISELSGLGRKNTAFVKAIVSEASDRIRHPYGRFTETLPRQGIFIGTTNHFQYLEDETGNRRFWPVRVGKRIDVEGITAARDQLFAEAKAIWKKGEPLYIENPEVEKIARQVQTSRMSEDTWQGKIEAFFEAQKDLPEKDRFPVEKFKILDLFSTKGPLRENMDTEAHLRRACRACRRLGYRPRDARGEEGHGKYWVKE